ncbi:DUF4838 domain-containing protein [Flagellimonas nanhaiensis]|uniref:DUF4838 domain-containing protein n=1 Tax=Flagellimonas nanhaiensis TaxID=2292706 RepID=A0A371JPB6_9FLAO|nr:DUF4838 domain-containing protein [Allomuricauda nanhaiensis]RDY59347.1 DUF4838 domain-containing protein [Allomuricauda nanhaiensis]
MRKTYYTLLFFIGIMVTSCSSDHIVLVKNGKTNYEIVHLGSASENQYKSAEKLQSYLQKISGAKLELVDESSQTLGKNKIYIGTIKEEELTPHQIRIRTENDNVSIAGGSDMATNNAVYEFLEKFLDCKWYAPNAEEIPSLTTISLDPIDFSYIPEITTRTVHSKLFYENPEFADQLKVTYEAFPTYVPSARVHTFHKFMPEEVFYQSHPEYYALREGKRLPTQLCLTNEKVLEIVKDSVSALFDRHPDALVISVSQDDNQQYCQCPNCNKIDVAEGSPAGTMIHFVNKVARAFPDKTISTLAYQHTRKPPKIKPEENVLITLCSIECDRSGPISEKCTDFADDLKNWGKLTNNIRIWDYTTQFTNFLAPFPNIKTLKPNIELFRDNNAKWVFEQHSHNPSELFELRSYITAKLLWNPNLNFEELLEQFTNGYYHEAGPFVKSYVDLIHSKLSEDDDFFLFLYGDPSEAFNSYLSPEMLDEYSRLFEQAESAVASKSEILKRVKMARMGVDYARLEASRKNLSENYSLTLSDENGIESINPKVALLLDNFSNTAKENNITLMNEMGFTVKEYGSNYISALEMAKKPNKAKGKKVISITNPTKYADENPMVLTDGALGGSSFYANWLGYVGTDMEVIVDLEELQHISSISMAFLQVTNHVVFFPTSVTYYGSQDNKNFIPLGSVKNLKPLTKTSKINEINYFDQKFSPTEVRYVKVVAEAEKTPYWHHYAGLPSWVFADEIIID